MHERTDTEPNERNATTATVLTRFSIDIACSVDGLPPEIPFWDTLSSILFDDESRKTDAGVDVPVDEQPERSSVGLLARAAQEGK